MQSSHYRNTLLKCLDAETIQRLELRRVTFELEHEIECPGCTLKHLYFLEEGMASVTTTFKDGSQVEVGMFGSESVIGISGLMGTKRSLNRVYTQIAGFGFSCALGNARTEFKACGTFQAIALSYVQSQLVQAMQSAGCNAKHSVEQRLARWLLTCADRAGSSQFLMSHEFLGYMLGSARPTVSLAAGILRDEGLIQYSRGMMWILDRKGLEKRACECYEVIRHHLDTFAEFDSGITC